MPIAPVSSKDCAMTPWEHILQTRMIPDIHDYDIRYGIRDSTDKLFHSQVAFDGEMVILKETQKLAVQKDLRDNDIGMVKGRPSGTEYDNACDMHLYFMHLYFNH